MIYFMIYYLCHLHVVLYLFLYLFVYVVLYASTCMSFCIYFCICCLNVTTHTKIDSHWGDYNSNIIHNLCHINIHQFPNSPIKVSQATCSNSKYKRIQAHLFGVETGELNPPTQPHTLPWRRKLKANRGVGLLCPLTVPIRRFTRGFSCA